MDIIFSSSFSLVVAMSILTVVFSSLWYLSVFLGLAGHGISGSPVIAEGVREYYRRFRDRFARVMGAFLTSLLLNIYILNAMLNSFSSFEDDVQLRMVATSIVILGVLMHLLFTIWVGVVFSRQAQIFSKNDLRQSGRIGSVIQTGFVFISGLLLAITTYLLLKHFRVELTFLRI